MPIHTNLTAKQIKQGFMVFNAQKESMCTLDDEFILPRTQSPEQILINREWASDFCKETQKMIEIIVSSPYEIVDSICKISAHFEKDLKWSRSTVRACVKEIKTFLRSN